ncbi:MAG: large repetitive protein [Solirubrobacteraceae bacterium]|nr:large repetitive protein [Solirubrobacteraceae bacterium]
MIAERSSASRCLACLVCVCTAALLVAGRAPAAPNVLPRPTVAITETASVHGPAAVLVRVIQVGTKPGAQSTVACHGCARYQGRRIFQRSLPGGGREFRGLNWVMTRTRALVIQVTARGELGWFFVIGIDRTRHPRLVYRSSGCLGVDRRPTRCPVGTQVPPMVGQPVGPTPSGVPATTIVSGPAGTVSTRPNSFSYTASLPGATFECRLDGASWLSCPASGISYANLGDGSHAFSVRAVLGGVVDPAPPVRAWFEQTPARTTILSGPSGTVTTLPVTFAYASTNPAASFQCSLDSGPWVACPSAGVSYDTVSLGDRAFSVRAVVNGVVDPQPPVHVWTQAAPTPPPPPPPPVYVHHVYHTCANGACGLKERAGPGYSNYAQVAIKYDGDEVDIICQDSGEAVSGLDGSSSTVWDKLSDTYWVADFYVDTSGMNGAFSPPIPHC